MLCEKFGDYCLDLSKLIFGGVILAAIMQLDINIVWLFVVGTVIVALTANKPAISGISGETFWLYLICVV